MTVGVLIRVRVKAEFRERFLYATRLYAQQTRTEATKPRVEVLELDGDDDEFLVRELYPNERTVEEHARSEHARQWHAAASELADGPITARRVAVVVGEPSVWPLSQRAAALETSTMLPSSRREVVPAGAPSAAVPTPRPLHLPRLQVVVERVEVASARDGFLRGAPDLCLLAACYRIAGREPEVLGRAVYRFELGEAAPCQVLRHDRVLDLPVSVEEFPLRVYVAVLAFEENGGSDVRAAYQELSDPSSLFFWSSLQGEPNPIGLGQHAAQLQPNHCERVQSLSPYAAHDEATRDDTWVGAASGLVEFSERGQERLLRFHTHSDHAENDWLWEMSFRFD